MTITNTESIPLAYFDESSDCFVYSQTILFESCEPLKELPKTGNCTMNSLFAAPQLERKKVNHKLFKTPEASMYARGRVHRYLNAQETHRNHGFCQLQDELEALIQGYIK